MRRLLLILMLSMAVAAVRAVGPALAFDSDRFCQGVVTEHAVAEALNAGYRRLQMSAESPNIEAVGRALAATPIPRDQLHISVVLDPPKGDSACVNALLDSTLARLATTYVDLAYLRLPAKDLAMSLKALRQAKASGKVHAIGLANFGVAGQGNLFKQVASALRGSLSDVSPTQAFFGVEGSDEWADIDIVQISSMLYVDPTDLAAELADMGIDLECHYDINAAYVGDENPINPDYRPDPYASRLLTDLASAHQVTEPELLACWHLNQRLPVVIAVSDMRLLPPIDLRDIALSSHELDTLALLADEAPSPLMALLKRLIEGYTLYTR